MMKKETTLSFCFLVKIGLIAVDSAILENLAEWSLWKAAVDALIQRFEQRAGRDICWASDLLRRHVTS